VIATASGRAWFQTPASSMGLTNVEQPQML